MKKYILAVDQGTTSSRAILFDQSFQPLSMVKQEIKQYYPQKGWVEHDPEEILASVKNCCHKVMVAARVDATEILCMGISNQRETTIVWDKTSGKALYPAIVWQDRRTANWCQAHASDHKLHAEIQHKTGLLFDPYFSATKLAWILQNVDNAQTMAANGQLLFGTIDCYLLWQLTRGSVHATDVTNASRTLLFNLHQHVWDEELLTFFGIPPAMLPSIVENCGVLGLIDMMHFGVEIPICGMSGDQQAALVGQACFSPGMIKSTYGTGNFLMMNTGEELILSKNKMLSTIAYQWQGKTTYALEGSAFMAGAAVQWLRDALHLFQSSSETEALAASLEDNAGVYMVPAFTGLGAPYWAPDARGAILGLTRDTSAAHLVRATLEAVAYQSRDLLLALRADYAKPLSTLRVDGAMVANNWFVQFLADILSMEIQRPYCIETSALGAAILASLGVGLYGSFSEIEALFKIQRSFKPKMDITQSDILYQQWKAMVAKVLH